MSLESNARASSKFSSFGPNKRFYPLALLSIKLTIYINRKFKLNESL